MSHPSIGHCLDWYLWHRITLDWDLSVWIQHWYLILLIQQKWHSPSCWNVNELRKKGLEYYLTRLSSDLQAIGQEDTFQAMILWITINAILFRPKRYKSNSMIVWNIWLYNVWRSHTKLHFASQHLYVYLERGVVQELFALHEKYIIVPVDKAANIVTVVSKSYYKCLVERIAHL